MGKKPMQDVVPPERRSIRNVTLPNRAPQAEPITEPIINESRIRMSEVEKRTDQIQKMQNVSGHGIGFKIGIWLIVVLAIFLFIGTIMMVFAKATITVTPKHIPISVVADIVADQSGSVESIPFETISLGKISNVEVPASGQTFVSEKARGTITIYNNFSTNSQRLVKNTRFATPAGLIYRIDTSVTIPGRKVEGGVTIPGSVDALVFADEAGPSYNISSAEFTIPGFKDDPARFTKFYAKTKTEIKGGFIGNIPKVEESVKQQKYTEMEAVLSERLVNEITAAVPPGFILFNGAITFATSTGITTPATGGAIIELAATATAYILPEKQFALSLARVAIPDFVDGFVRVKDQNTLVVTIKKLPSVENPTIAFSVKGDADIVWVYDEKAIKEAVVGQPIKNAGSILSRFTALSGDPIVSIQPFYKRSFPATPTRIIIKEAVE